MNATSEAALTLKTAHWTCQRYGFTPLLRDLRGDRSRWEVLGSDGKRLYLVSFVERIDGECLWTCDCPAGQRGRPCKHVAAISRALSYED